MAGRGFEIGVDWLGRDSADPLERFTAAEIGIFLPDGRSLTKIEDTFAQTVRRTARLSAHDLASWFATNWWRLRWEAFADTSAWRMAKLFGFPADTASGDVAFEPIPIAFRAAGSANDLDIHLSASGSNARRFQFMRLIGGHLTLSAPNRFVPATRAATARQKVQRAFAAEFLCPIDGLRDLFGTRSPDGDDIDAAAERYGVSSRVVENIWANRRSSPPA